MAFNFPDAPTEGQLFTDTSSGAQYVYKSGVWMQSSAAQIKLGALEANILVNPRMQISQQWSAGTVLSTSAQYPADQWAMAFGVNAGNPVSVLNTLTTDDWTLPEAVPLYYVRLSHNGTPTPAPAAANSHGLYQFIERSRIRLLGWFQPTAGNRKPAVLRFAAKLNNVTVATTFSVSIRDGSVSASWVKQFTVQPADTGKWIKYETPVPAPSIGSWGGVDADLGMYLSFIAMAGSTYVGVEGWQAGDKRAGPGQSNLIGATTANQLDIANVGLYVDPQASGVAPPFQANPPSYDLDECLRYFWKALGSYTMYVYNNNAAVRYHVVKFPVPMVANPSPSYSLSEGGAAQSVNPETCSVVATGVGVTSQVTIGSMIMSARF